MNDKNFDKHDPEQQLDRALDAIRHQEIPPFPKSELEHFEKAELVSPSPKQTHRNRFAAAVPILAACAAALVISAIIFWPQANKTAFAKVQEALQNLQTIRYNVFDYHPHKTYTTKVTMKEPGLSRSDSKHGGSFIYNRNSGMQFQIDHKKKTATLFETDLSADQEAILNRFVDMLRSIPEHATEFLGETELDGVRAEQFLVKIGDRDFEVTVNFDTKLPIQMEFVRDEKFREVITDFVFDEPVDDEIFAMLAPDGYEAVTRELGDQHALAKTMVVSPETGLDHLGFKSSIEDFIAYLGEPSSREGQTFEGPMDTVHESTTLKYNNAGLSLFFNSEGLASFSCSSGHQVIDFAGKTDKGIRLGDSTEAVIKAYGDPAMTSENVLNYIREGLAFYHRGNKITSIDVSEPVHPNIVIEVHEEGGGYSMRMRRDDEQDENQSDDLWQEE